MNQIIKNPVHLALILYLTIVSSIIYLKPKLFFDKEGNIKCTGCGDHKYKTIFSLPIFIVLISIIIYFIIIYYYN